MEVKPYCADMAEDVAEAYNEAIRYVPYCRPITVEEWAQAFAPKSGSLQSRTAWVACDGPHIVGYVDAGLGKTSLFGDKEEGVIPFLWYRRGERAAGQCLLTTAEGHLRDQGATSSQAFPQEYRYPFYYLKAAYLSDRLDHVGALLALHGYERRRGEVFLSWWDMEIEEEPSPPDGMDVTIEHTRGLGRLPGVTVRARQDNEEIGTCECVSCGEYSSHETAQEWVFTTWLGVAEPFQGKRIGAFLLEYALYEAHAIGYRNAAISTAWNNPRALVFYSNFGYRLTDWTYGLARDLA